MERVFLGADEVSRIMKKLGLLVFAFALLGASAPQDLAGTDAGTNLSTERRVHGVITSIEPAKLTIASQQHAVSGTLDPVRTKVTIGGKPAKLADLKLTDHAKGQLCLDDVWLAIDAH
jgi:hypothetical protein